MLDNYRIIWSVWLCPRIVYLSSILLSLSRRSCNSKKATRTSSRLAIPLSRRIHLIWLILDFYGWLCRRMGWKYSWSWRCGLGTCWWLCKWRLMFLSRRVIQDLGPVLQRQSFWRQAHSIWWRIRHDLVWWLQRQFSLLVWSAHRCCLQWMLLLFSPRWQGCLSPSIGYQEVR